MGISLSPRLLLRDVLFKNNFLLFPGNLWGMRLQRLDLPGPMPAGRALCKGPPGRPPESPLLPWSPGQKRRRVAGGRGEGWLLHIEPAFLEGACLTHILIHIQGDSTPWRFIPDWLCFMFGSISVSKKVEQVLSALIMSAGVKAGDGHRVFCSDGLTQLQSRAPGCYSACSPAYRPP